MVGVGMGKVRGKYEESSSSEGLFSATDGIFGGCWRWLESECDNRVAFIQPDVTTYWGFPPVNGTD